MSYTKYVDPTIITCDDEHVSFCFSDNGVNFAISAIYALTDHVKINLFWTALERVQNYANIMWSCIGDFNSIIGAHKHIGAYPLAIIPMMNFLSWLNKNNFFHMPTKGNLFTWSNGRK